MTRIEVFKQILETDPANSNVLFGLAKEYEKAGEDEELIAVLAGWGAGLVAGNGPVVPQTLHTSGREW